jgi:hypothetical protein
MDGERTDTRWRTKVAQGLTHCRTMLGLAGETRKAKYPANDEMGAQSLLRGGTSIGTEILRNDTQPPIYAAWPQDVRDVPDMLVAAQLSLRSLAKDEATATSAEAKRIVGDACDLLGVALVNIVQVTKNMPGFPLEGAGANAASRPHRAQRRDPRMSSRSDDDQVVVAQPEQCALTQPLARPSKVLPRFTCLTSEQLDRLRRCANGNTLRFESADIVAALVAAGYATEGVGRVVTVTPAGHQYLSAHSA